MKPLKHALTTFSDEDGGVLTVLSSELLPEHGGAVLPVLLVLASEGKSVAIALHVLELRQLALAMVDVSTHGSKATAASLACNDAEIRIAYDNRGEPYREGATIRLSHGALSVGVFLTRRDLQYVADRLSGSLNADPDALVRLSPDHFRSERHNLQREYGKTPNGNDLNGRWVLRDRHGAWIDWDKYANDIAERHGLSLYQPQAKASAR